MSRFERGTAQLGILLLGGRGGSWGFNDLFVMGFIWFMLLLEGSRGF